MASRPRRAAAQKANTAITDMVDSDNITSSKTGKIMSSRAQSRRSEGKTAVATITRGPPSSPSDSNQHIHITVKLPASKLRQATSNRTGQSSGRVSLSSRENFEGGEILEGKRNRNQKKSYVVESSEDDDDDAEGEDDEDAEGEDDDMMDLGDDDAEGEIVVDDSMDLDVDAEGEDDDDLGDEDAEGEDDDLTTIDVTPVAPILKVSKPASSKAAASKARSAAKPAQKQAVQDENSDDELSELDSEEDEIQDTVNVGGGDDEDEDAEGEDDDEIEAAGAAGQDDEDDEELLSDDEDGSRAATPDFTKMTKRQRARFEDDDGTLMKLSDG
jgi:Ino eighty subunit 2